VDVVAYEVIGVLDMEYRTGYGEVDSRGWEEETKDSVGATQVGVEV